MGFSKQKHEHVSGRSQHGQMFCAAFKYSFLFSLLLNSCKYNKISIRTSFNWKDYGYSTCSHSVLKAFFSGAENELSQLNIFSVITSHLESSVVIRLPGSAGNDAFDIYSCGASIPDALVVCSLFYWAPWVSLSLLLSSAANSVTTVLHPPDSRIDQLVDVAHRTAQSQFGFFSVQILDDLQQGSSREQTGGGDVHIHGRQKTSAAFFLPFVWSLHVLLHACMSSPKRPPSVPHCLISPGVTVTVCLRETSELFGVYPTSHLTKPGICSGSPFREKAAYTMDGER